MKLSKLVSEVNRIVGQGNHSIVQLLSYFDECVEMINADLNIHLPLISEVYEKNFTLNDDEADADYAANSTDNDYKRIPDAYLRNFVAYEVAYKVLRDEDEDMDVTNPKKYHANDWYRRLVAAFSDYSLEDTEAVSIGGDADELNGVVDDAGVGFYNPL